LIVYFDPFDTPAGVCIPCDLFPLPSQKVKTTFRGVGNLGTTGYGWVAVNPTLANDVASIQVTSTASVGGSSTVLSAYTNIGTGMFTMLPYAAADFSGGSVQGRIVAVGIRVSVIAVPNLIVVVYTWLARSKTCRRLLLELIIP